MRVTPVIAHATRRVRLRVLPAKDGQFYFALVAGNGEAVGVSETYTRKADAVRGAERFRDLVSLAEVE